MPLVNNKAPLIDMKKNQLATSASLEDNKPPSRQATPAKAPPSSKLPNKVRSPFDVVTAKVKPLMIKQTVAGCLLAVVRSGGMCILMYIMQAQLGVWRTFAYLVGLSLPLFLLKLAMEVIEIDS